MWLAGAASWTVLGALLGVPARGLINLVDRRGRR